MSSNEEIMFSGGAKPSIGIIGTGWVGASYAHDFRTRGFSPVCYSLDPAYRMNRDRIKDCDIVFIAVPTPTDAGEANYAIIREVLGLVGSGKIAVIKSTILPGTTSILQGEFPDVMVMHSPEFLSVATAEYDAAHPQRNIIGIPASDQSYQQAARKVLDILPPAPYSSIGDAVNAELIKYAHNCGGYLRIVFNNMLYDISKKMNGDWNEVKTAMAAAYPGNELNYLDPVHKNGRGAGGPCFIKDFSAFNEFYKILGDNAGTELLAAIQAKNISLLEESNKDLDILYAVLPGMAHAGK